MSALRAQLRAFSAARPRWGYRQAHTHLQNEGWEINRKRVQRVWRDEGLRVPRRARKRRRLGDSTAPKELLRAGQPGHVWAFDVQFDQTADGRAVKLLNVVDEFTREARVRHVDRSITADQTVTVLERLVAARGAPRHIRCDNGPGDDRSRADRLVRPATHDDQLHRSRRPMAKRVRGVLPLACVTSCSTSSCSPA